MSAACSLSSLKELGEGEQMTDEEENDNLDWNPIDGMHAERQLSVRDLKEFFEMKKKRNLRKRRSQV